MRTSGKGLEDLAREEGLRLAPYNDSAGHATVGVGHLIHRGPVTAADRRRYAGFTRSQAIALLKRDVAIAENAVNAVGRALPQRFFDATVSLVFNIGTGGFATSTVRRQIKAGDLRAAADAFLMWRHGNPGDNVLLGRRKRERAICLAALKRDVDPLELLMPTERRWCQEYDRLRGPASRGDHTARMRRQSLERAMLTQRKRVWRAAGGAKGGGWETAHRRVRYRELLERTRA